MRHVEKGRRAEIGLVDDMEGDDDGRPEGVERLELEKAE